MGAVGPEGSVGPAGADGAPGVDGAPGPAGPAGADGVSGYEVVSGATPAPGNPPSLTVTATCPAGKIAISGGYDIDAPIDGNREPPFLFSSLPSAPDTWSVTFERGSITRRSWTATACAVCVATP